MNTSDWIAGPLRLDRCAHQPQSDSTLPASSVRSQLDPTSVSRVVELRSKQAQGGALSEPRSALARLARGVQGSPQARRRTAWTVSVTGVFIIPIGFFVIPSVRWSTVVSASISTESPLSLNVGSRSSWTLPPPASRVP